MLHKPDLPRTFARYIPILSLAGDFILLNLFFVAGFCYFKVDGSYFAPRYLLFYIYLNLIWLILVLFFGTHKIDQNTSKKSILFKSFNITVFFFFLFLLYFQVTPLSYYPRDTIKYLFPVFFIFILTWKFLLYYAFYFYRKIGFSLRNVIILGYTPLTIDLQIFFQNNKWAGYSFLGFFSGKNEDNPNILGRWPDLKAFLDSNQVDEIYVALNEIPRDILPEINEIIDGHPVKVRIVPDLGAFSFKSAELVNYGALPVLKIHRGPLSYWSNRLIKRVFDVLLSIFMILFVVSWISLLLYLLSRCGICDGVFFRQTRTGIDGHQYTCIKFRTMKRSFDADLKQATRDDHRVSKTGKILRKYSLDELPQFFNVFLGEMSVVGPRPHMLAHTGQYRKMIRQFMLRHTVKPGITGLAQVEGYRGEIRDVNDIRRRVDCDVQYIVNWSIILDIKIMLKTIWVIINGQEEAY